ncbi:MAG: hypothetical protein H7A34_01700 [bacterium]|nr:hypothetical protein [bacterium]
MDGQLKGEGHRQTNEGVRMDRKNFLCTTFIGSTMIAGLATRSKEFPVYNKKRKKRDLLKKHIRKTIMGIAHKVEYQNGTVSSDEHVQLIEYTARDVSEKFYYYLHNGRLRIGVTQKLINLYLKFLWCAKLIKQPPHCPIDGFVRDIVRLEYNWISSDCIDDYKKPSMHSKYLEQKELQEFI